MAKQELDLIQFAASIPTEPGTGSSQIVWCKGQDANFRSGRLHHVPNSLFADAVSENAARSADTPKHLSTIDRGGAEPAQKLRVHPIRHRNRSNMTSLTDKVHDGPMFLSLLQILDSETGSLMASQPTS
jgi:hypothetical protein